MSKHDRLSVLNAMMAQSVIPVFYHPDTELCKNVIQACANAGAANSRAVVRRRCGFMVSEWLGKEVMK